MKFGIQIWIYQWNFVLSTFFYIVAVHAKSELQNLYEISMNLQNVSILWKSGEIMM